MSAEPGHRRRATVFQQGNPAGFLEEVGDDSWRFTYFSDFGGQAVSLTMPVRAEPYEFNRFPAVFEGLLPEGVQLDALLRTHKIDRDDSFSQLVVVGADMIGSLSVKRACEPEEEPEN